MRASGPGQSALLMADIAESLARQGVRYAVIGAMTAFVGGPVDLADARAVMALDRGSLDLELLRRLAQRFGRDTTQIVEELLGAVDG